MTDLDCAVACNLVYNNPATFDRIIDVCGVIAGIKIKPEGTLIAFRGSDSAEDWLRDLDAIPVNHKTLGYVHAGFMDGMEEFAGAVGPIVRGPVTLTGHSLGAARAALLAAMLVLDGKPPSRVVLFGCPRPGFARLAKILSTVTVHSYRHLSDPVTQVPELFDLYQPCAPLIPLTSAPAPLDPIEDHLIAGYCRAIAALVPSGVMGGTG